MTIEKELPKDRHPFAMEITETLDDLLQKGRTPEYFAHTFEDWLNKLSQPIVPGLYRLPLLKTNDTNHMQAIFLTSRFRDPSYRDNILAVNHTYDTLKGTSVHSEIYFGTKHIDQITAPALSQKITVSESSDNQDRRMEDHIVEYLNSPTEAQNMDLLWKFALPRGVNTAISPQEYKEAIADALTFLLLRDVVVRKIAATQSIEIDWKDLFPQFRNEHPHSPDFYSDVTTRGRY